MTSPATRVSILVRRAGGTDPHGAVAATAVVLAVWNGVGHLGALGEAEWEGPGDGRTSGPHI